MPNSYNKKELELLAPAGNFEIFMKIIKLGCDAVYLGGKKLNMRMHRKNFNFSDDELREAISITHSLGKKIYITVNNLHDSSDLAVLPDYLRFLEQIKPDAIIIQDFSIIEVMKKCGIKLPTHASVMTNTHNIQSLKRLKELGISRTVLSRELSLDQVKLLSLQTSMELEYFIHGDMCVCHGGQCLYSSMIFGQSSNRGLCMKPCRWRFDIEQNGKSYATGYPLAVKDMYMYEHIPELINAGIVSFKIEGRMREFEYLKQIIDAYSDAIHRFVIDPAGFNRKKHSKDLYDNRLRDFSTGYAFGKPGLDNINKRFEGTGKFYSTGKVFSSATEERSITEEKIKLLSGQILAIGTKDRKAIQHAPNYEPKKLKLNSRVNNITQAEICIKNNFNRVYLSADVFLPDSPFSADDIKYLNKIKGETEVFAALPHMMYPVDFDAYSNSEIITLSDGVLCTNLGAVCEFKSKRLHGDYPLNIYNSISADFYMKEGLESFTLSPELPLAEVLHLLAEKGQSAEMIVHGSPSVMYLEHDLYANFENKTCPIFLIDEKGFKHPALKDVRGRNHLLMYKNLCLLPLLKELNSAGLTSIRLEISHFDNENFIRTAEAYALAVKTPDKSLEIFYKLQKLGDYTLGALEF